MPVCYANHSRKARRIARLIDTFSMFLSPWARRAPERQLRKVLVLRPDHLGDLLMAGDALHSFADANPQCRLHLLTPEWNRTLAERLSFIEKTHYVNLRWYCFNREPAAGWRRLFSLIRELRRERYDMAVDMRGDVRLVFLFAFLAGARIRRGFSDLGGRNFLNSVVPFSTRIHYSELAFQLLAPYISARLHYTLPIREPERGRARALCQKHGLTAGRFVIIHPAVSLYWEEKKWPEESFAAVAGHLIEHHRLPVVLCAGMLERSSGARIAARVPGVIDLSGQLPLPEFTALLRESLFLISNDSAPMHLAVNQEVPLIAVFGPTSYRRSGPWPLSTLRRAIEGDPGLPRPSFGGSGADPRFFPSVETVIRETDELIRLLLPDGA
jgi:ADP-heptose:LPS heptosyltransferase